MTSKTEPPTADDAWKQTVRDIFDELHFGSDSVFEGAGRELARRIVSTIEARHHDYFCAGRVPNEHQQASG